MSDAPLLHLDGEACAAAVAAAFGAKGKGASVDLDPDTVEQDLARLVLALMEFLRQLMEAQAIRRMEAGALTAEQEDRVGETLMRAREALVDMAGRFDLDEEALSLDLGPLGRLV